MTTEAAARREALLSVIADAVENTKAHHPNYHDDEPVRKLVSETTDEGGIIRLEYWPMDGYVLWYHGRCVWKSWETSE